MVLAGFSHLSGLGQEFLAKVPAWLPIDGDLVVVLSGELFEMKEYAFFKATVKDKVNLLDDSATLPTYTDELLWDRSDRFAVVRFWWFFL